MALRHPRALKARSIHSNKYEPEWWLTREYRAHCESMPSYPTLAETWRRAPLQAIARLHVLAAHGLAGADEVGRPKAGTPVSDLHVLSQQIAAASAEVPAVVLAAVVHGELLRLSPFSRANGIVARAAERLVLMDRGLDPNGFVPTEVGHDNRRPEYIGAAHAYATGTVDGVRAWLKHCCAAVVDGTAVAAEY